MGREAFDLAEFYRGVDRCYRQTTGDGVLRYLRDAAAKVVSTGDASALAAVASELGSVLRVRGELDAAQALYEAAAGALERTGAPALSRCNLAVNLGDVYVAQGNAAAAIAQFDAAERLLPNAEAHPYELSAICNNRAAAYRAAGDFARARQDLRHASSLLAQVPGSEGQRAVNAVNLAQILMCEGKLTEARAEIEGALDAYRTLSGGRDIHRPHALATAGQIAYLSGDYVSASDYLGQAIDALEDKVGEAQAAQRLRAEKDKVDAILKSEVKS